MQPHRIFAAAAAIVALGTTPAFSQGKSGNAAKGGAPKNTASAPTNHGGGTPKTNSRGGPKNTPASGAAAKNVAATSNATAPKNSGNSLGTSNKGPDKNVAAASPASNVPNTTGDNTPTPTANAFANTPNTMPTPPTTPNKVSTKLTGNPARLARVQAMLPAGMTLEQASSGFRNQGQFLAALNASKNRGLPFADLQWAMTVDGLSLGQAAKLLRNAPVIKPGNANGNTPIGGPNTPIANPNIPIPDPNTPIASGNTPTRTANAAQP